MNNSSTAEDAMEGEVGPGRKKMPIEREGITHKVEITSVTDGQTHEGYIMGNLNEDGTLGEIFLHGFGKQGSTVEGWTQLAAMLFSYALQYGAEFPVLARKISYMKFEPYGTTNNPEIPHCRSVPDYVVRWLALRFGDQQLVEDLRKIDKKLEAL